MLLPLFFLLHAWLENFNPALAKDVFILLLIYTGAAMLIAILFWFVYRDSTKAALVTFFIMACNFFFGSTHEFLKKIFDHSFITRLSFIIPAMLILILTFIIYVKKSKHDFLRTTRYLNILLLLLVLLDGGKIVSKFINSKGPAVSDLSQSLKICDTCTTPDIYFIITDEYAGKTELKELFSFDNSVFENELQARGFHIINNSTSNYNATVYSLASMLNMDYIKNMDKPSVVNHRDMLMCRGLIKTNNLVSFLQKNGYSFYNNSFFDIADKKKVFHNIFFSTNRSLLTHQTFINRFIYHFGTRFTSDEKIATIKMNSLYSDITIDSLTRITVLQKDAKAKFVYSHLKMPHHPYFFDSLGNKTSVQQLTDSFAMNRKAYISYLKFANKKLLSLIDFIQKNTGKPTAVILMSDHGFRQLSRDVDRKYHFMNLNAVFLPDSNYSDFCDGMSNVNQFRVTLNTLFGQKLPMLKDSTSFLTE